jgi:hypothetical protein
MPSYLLQIASTSDITQLEIDPADPAIFTFAGESDVPGFYGGLGFVADGATSANLHLREDGKLIALGQAKNQGVNLLCTLFVDTPNVAPGTFFGFTSTKGSVGTVTISSPHSTSVTNANSGTFTNAEHFDFILVSFSRPVKVSRHAEDDSLKTPPRVDIVDP